MSLARRASAVAVAACLTLGVGATAAGAVGASARNSASVALSAHGRVTIKTYAQLLADYEKSLTRINYTYGQHVAAAHSKFLKSLARARSAADKLHARAAYRNAVVLATTEREVELEILGSPPHSDQSSGDGQSASGDN